MSPGYCCSRVVHTFLVPMFMHAQDAAQPPYDEHQPDCHAGKHMVARVHLHTCPCTIWCYLYCEDAECCDCWYLQVGCCHAQGGAAHTQQQRTQQRKGKEVSLKGGRRHRQTITGEKHGRSNVKSHEREVDSSHPTAAHSAAPEAGNGPVSTKTQQRVRCT
jgi:hypothetical protein